MHDGFPAEIVGDGCGYAFYFVMDVIDVVFGAEHFAVDFDVVAGGVDFYAEFADDFAVDFDSAFADEFLAFASGVDAAAGHEFL